MKTTEDTFTTYLRGEVASAGERFDKTTEKMMQLTEGPVELNPALLDAIESLRDDFRAYVSALRRQAHYVTHASALEERRRMAARV